MSDFLPPQTPTPGDRPRGPEAPASASPVPGPSQAPAAGQSNGKATASFVLGILGLLVCPLVCSIIAVVLGYSARREIAASGGRQSGSGLATAGIVLGWVGIGLSILGIVVLAALIAAGDLDPETDIFTDPDTVESVVRLIGGLL